MVNYHSSSEAALETVADIEALGRRAVAVRADVTRPDDILELKEAADKARADLALNEARVSGDRWQATFVWTGADGTQHAAAATGNNKRLAQG